MATNKQIKQQIKNATTAVTPKVNTNYKAGDYEKLNPSVQKAAETTVTNATNSANQAYQLAAKNNAQHASEAHANNNMTTRQIGSSMKKNNYSLTNRNVASAASARSASTINTAHTNANRNAEVTRDTSISKAKQTAYKNMAENMLSNSKLDIQRSTERAKVKAEQHMTSKENMKSRNLKNALYRKNAKLQNKVDKYNKKKENLSTYTSSIPNRLTTVSAVDKAIASMKKSKDSLKSQKLAYLRAYRASLKKAEAAQKRSGGGGGGRGGRGGYGRRGYGSGGSSTPDSLGGNNGKTYTKGDARKAATSVGTAMGLIGEGMAYGAKATGKANKAKSKPKSSTNKRGFTPKGRGSKYSSGTNYKRSKGTPSYITAMLKRIK